MSCQIKWECGEHTGGPAFCKSVMSKMTQEFWSMSNEES